MSWTLFFQLIMLMFFACMFVTAFVLATHTTETKNDDKEEV